jgi:hypothetical protein
MMSSDEFIKIAKKSVRDYVNDHVDVTDKFTISDEDVYVVWYCFILGNSKALISTSIPDGMYYEVTYDSDKKCIYLDAYKKIENLKIELD